MKKRLSYQFLVLRYRHDAFSGESLNVGVLLSGGRGDFVGGKFDKTFGRAKNLFPDIDTEAFKGTIRRLEGAVRKYKIKNEEMPLFDKGGVQKIATTILKQDDSSFLWSKIGSGLCSDYQSELDAIYSRFVKRDIIHDDERRSDSDIWKPIRERLSNAELSKRLESVEIKSNLSSVKFDHAWKNGKWHCYQPLSFDLSTSDGIRDKAARWAGYMVGLASVPDFKPYFLIGEPADERLHESYSKAVQLLKSSSSNAEIYEERESDAFALKIENQLRSYYPS